MTTTPKRLTGARRRDLGYVVWLAGQWARQEGRSRYVYATAYGYTITPDQADAVGQRCIACPPSGSTERS